MQSYPSQCLSQYNTPFSNAIKRLMLEGVWKIVVSQIYNKQRIFPGDPWLQTACVAYVKMHMI